MGSNVESTISLTEVRGDISAGRDITSPQMDTVWLVVIGVLLLAAVAYVVVSTPAKAKAAAPATNNAVGQNDIDTLIQDQLNDALALPTFNNATFAIESFAPGSSISGGLNFGDSAFVSSSNDIGSMSVTLNEITNLQGLKITSFSTGTPVWTGITVVIPITVQVTTLGSPNIQTAVFAGFSPPLPGVTSYSETPTFTISPPTFTLNCSITGTYNLDGATTTFNTDTFKVNSISSNIDLTQLSNQILNLGAATSLFSGVFSGPLSSLNSTVNTAINNGLQKLFNNDLHFPSATIVVNYVPPPFCSENKMTLSHGACTSSGYTEKVSPTNLADCIKYFCPSNPDFSPVANTFNAFTYDTTNGCVGYVTCTPTAGTSIVSQLNWV